MEERSGIGNISQPSSSSAGSTPLLGTPLFNMNHHIPFDNDHRSTSTPNQFHGQYTPSVPVFAPTISISSGSAAAHPVQGFSGHASNQEVSFPVHASGVPPPLMDFNQVRRHLEMQQQQQIPLQLPQIFNLGPWIPAQNQHQNGNIPIQDRQQQQQQAESDNNYTSNVYQAQIDNSPYPDTNYSSTQIPMQIEQKYLEGQFSYIPNFIHQVPADILELLKRPSLTHPSEVTWKSHRSPPSFYKVQGQNAPRFRQLFQNLLENPQVSTTNPPKGFESFVEFRRLKLDSQLEHFFLAQSLTREETRIRWQFVSDLFFTLREYANPRCELFIFGSMLTHLSDASSDIDIFVDLEGTSFKNSSATSSGQKSLKIVAEVLETVRCPHTFFPFLNRVFPLEHARIPILRIIHSSNLHCDLSFENRLSVQNTKLLRFYMDMDPNIARFLKLIRYWAKYHDLIGSRSIRSYAMVLLGIVYLCENSLVPSVALLQYWKAAEREKLKITKNPDEIDLWDASFCNDLKFVKKNFKGKPFPGCERGQKPSNSRILINMVLDFFTMYASIDFTEWMVCPLLGRILPKSDFAPHNEARLATCFDSYKKRGMRLPTSDYLVIQDPFVHSFNVGNVTEEITLHQFQKACETTHQTLQHSGNVNSLLDLFVPFSIDERQFRKAFMTEIKSRVYRRIIEPEFVTEEPNTIENGNGSASTLSTGRSRSYCLKPSTRSVRSTHSVGDNCLLKTLKNKTKWFYKSVVKLTNQVPFEAIFLTEVCRHIPIRDIPHQEWTGVIAQLWSQFAKEFCDKIFGTGMLLHVIKDEENINTDCTLDDEANENWIISQLLQNQFVQKNTRETGAFLGKIKNLIKAKKHMYYRAISVQVSYPFWKDRLSYYPGEGAVTNIDVPVLRWKEDKADDDKVVYTCLKSFDPIKIETHSSKLMLNANNKLPFNSFGVTVFVTMTFNEGESRPHVCFHIKKDCNTTNPEADQGLYWINNVLTHGLPEYVTYRLAEWIQSDKPEPGPEQPPNWMKKKKHDSTQLEKDLLIPAPNESDDFDNEGSKNAQGTMVKVNETGGKQEKEMPTPEVDLLDRMNNGFSISDD